MTDAINHDTRRADDPDREAQRILQASMAQIDAATEETRGEIDGLAELVFALVGHAANLSDRLGELAVTEIDVHTLSAMRDEVSCLDATANKTIGRLQFAERLHQRLSSVQGNLDTLSDTLHESPLSRSSWGRFLDKSRAAFMMDAERVLLDGTEQPAPFKPSANQPLADNIALFATRRGDSNAD
ncbi:MAG: hypothetical protein AAGI27_15130 [Pseudomonadota bacterium]